MPSRSRYTLLIPTYNRPDHLRRLLGYLAARRFEFPIRVLDSSSGDGLSENRQTVGGRELDIAHEIYDPAIPIHKKVELGIASVKSTYCSLCADDDVLFTDELNGLLDILDANPGLVVAHGYYVNFRPGENFDIWYTDYSAPSIVADDALTRLVEQMSDYQAIFYGVHRTSTMKSIRVPLDRVKSLWAKELLTSTLALIDGGMCRVPRYYMARNSNPSIATKGWHPHQFFAIEPAELFREYADYRTVALEHLAADPRCRASYRSEQIQRVFDLIHLKYLAPMLSPGVMNYLIQQSMRLQHHVRADHRWDLEHLRASSCPSSRRPKALLRSNTGAHAPQSRFARPREFSPPGEHLCRAQISRKIRCHVEFFIRRHDRQTHHPEWAGAPLLDLPVVPGPRVC